MAGRKPRKRTPAPPPAAPAEPGCPVQGCGRDVHARGLCEAHWEDLARSRGPFTPPHPTPPESQGTPSPLKGDLLHLDYPY